MEEIALRIEKSVNHSAVLSRPYQLQLHLTNFCNLRCIFCPTKTFVPEHDLDRKNELSTKQWLGIVDEAVPMGIEEFHICGGGEPFFFREKALAVMRRIKELGKRGEIITNGNLIPSSAVNELVEIGWDKITFSIDGASNEVHDRIRGKECFKDILKTIRQFRDVKRDKHVQFPQISIHFVVCSLNYRDLPAMPRLCEELGVEDFLVQALNIWSENIQQYALNAKQLEECEELLSVTQSLADERGISTNIQSFLNEDLFNKANEMDSAMVPPSPESNLNNIPCFMAWYNISIFADGRVLPCFILREGGESLMEHSLQDIWKGRCFSRIRDDMRTGRLGKDCAKCNPWSMSKMQEIRDALDEKVKPHAR